MIELDSKTEKKVKQFLAREAKKLSTAEKKELKELENRALRLWRKVVVHRARGKCEFPACKKTKRINAHHIESSSTNKALRVDPRNGIGFCPTHHKFGRHSAHRSFCFMYELMTMIRPLDLSYLLDHYKDKNELTKEYLKSMICQLEKMLNKS